MTMEKYGVDQSEAAETEETGEEAHVCEKCGRVLMQHGETRLCPQHGADWRVRE